VHVTFTVVFFITSATGLLFLRAASPCAAQSATSAFCWRRLPPVPGTDLRWQINWRPIWGL